MPLFHITWLENFWTALIYDKHTTNSNIFSGEKRNTFPLKIKNKRIPIYHLFSVE